VDNPLFLGTIFRKALRAGGYPSKTVDRPGENLYIYQQRKISSSLQRKRIL